jgi:hypothetical protein
MLPMKLESVPPYPTNLSAGIPTNIVLNKTPAGQFQIARVLKPGGAEAEFEILHTSNSEHECRQFAMEQTQRDFPGLLNQR